MRPNMRSAADPVFDVATSPIGLFSNRSTGSNNAADGGRETWVQGDGLR